MRPGAVASQGGRHWATPMLAADLGLAEGGPRERLLAGLAQSIRERGLAGTQITHIVANARTSRSTFYKCFDDKDACFFELTRLTTNVGLAEVEAAVDVTASWQAQVEAAIMTYFDLLAVDHALTVAWSRDLAGLGPRGVAVQQEGIERYASLMCRLSARTGVSRLTMDAAVMLVGGINAMVVRAIERGEPNLGRLAPIAISLVQAAAAP
jgi:AcrR family transcriptional regulator